MSAPEVGKRYRIEATVEVREKSGLIDHPPDYVRVIGLNDGLTVISPLDKVTWTEVEPEYVVGALYVDVDGMARERIEPINHMGQVCVWRRVGSTLDLYIDTWMTRPLTRLYREGETP